MKIIPDRNFQHGGLNYGFVEYYEMRSAETALQTLGGRKIFDTEIRVNWAYQNSVSSPVLSTLPPLFFWHLLTRSSVPG